MLIAGVLVALIARPDIWRPRVAVASMFFLNGAIFGTWVTRIPVVQQRFRLSEGELGITLLAIAVGAIVAMPLTGRLSTRIGSRVVTLGAALAMCVALAMLAVAPSVILLIGALALFGASNGALDAAMNIQATAVERLSQRLIMASFHALFSVGSVAGATVGGVLAAQGVSLDLHFSLVALCFGCIAGLAWNWLLPDSRPRSQKPVGFARPPRSLLGVAIIALCVLVSEAAVADWSAVYLQNVLGANPGVAATGFVAFSLAMMIGRFLGDWVTHHIGAVLVVRGGSLLAASGLLLGLLVGEVWSIFFGFACAGLGIAATFPITLSSAARTPGVAPDAAIAAMSIIACIGSVIGPPVIGVTAELVTLRGALGLLVILCGISSICAHAVRPISAGI